MRRCAAALVLGLSLVTTPGVLPEAAHADILEELEQGFGYRVETLGYYAFTELEPDGADPGNILDFAHHEARLELRPDLDLDFRRLALGFRPRYRINYRSFDSGPQANTSETGDELFIQEWEIGLSLTDALLLSTGRIDLQWGPSYLLSPSNPFNRNNGLNDPQLEQPGLEYSQLAWMPGYRWTLTLIANTGPGRFTSGRPFSPRYAMRVDYTADGWFGGLIGSITEDEHDPVIGGFAGWTVTDALLLHAEWSVDTAVESGDPVKEGDYLLGGSYTLGGGAFAVAEFFRDGTGCEAPNIVTCFNPFAGDPADPTDLLFRQNYVLLQFTHPSWLDQVAWTARWIHGFDDGSSRLMGFLEWTATNHLQPFFTGLADFGGSRDEFGSVVQLALRAGASLVF